MAVFYELVWRSDGAERAFPVRGVVSIGRAPDNDLVLPSAQVSSLHARIWAEKGELWIADAGSTNGTFINDTQLTGKTKVTSDTLVRLGDLSLLVRRVEGATYTEERRVVEDLETGLQIPFSQRFVIGPSVEAHIRSEQVEALLVDSPTGLWVEQNGQRAKVEIGQAFAIGNLKLKVRLAGARTPRRTVRPNFGEGCYHIEATLDARTPWARIMDDDGQSLEVEGETRATLVYVLAKAILDSRRDGIAFEEEGWVEDQEVAAQVWGKVGRGGVGNKLSVVVYRLRADLKKAGMSADFVQRKRGRIRLSAGRISLSP